MSFRRIAFCLFVLLSPALVPAQSCTPFRNVNHRIIVKAMVNGKGPYSFLLDTGSQSTLIDTNLADALHLKNAGTVDVSGMGLHQSTGWTILGSIGTGGSTVTNLRVIFYDLTKTQGPEDARIYGIIGQDFLEHFDVEIYNQQSCLKLSKAL